MTDNEKIARNRFLLLGAIRFGGVALVLLGIAIHYGKVAMPQAAAWFCVIMGFIEFFFMPKLLKAHWRYEGGSNSGE